MESSLRSRESVASLGYALDLPSANLTFKGKLLDFNYVYTSCCYVDYIMHNAEYKKYNLITLFLSMVVNNILTDLQ